MGLVHQNKVNPFITFNTYLNYGSLLEAFCLCAGVEKLNEAPIFYLSPKISLPKNIPPHYIVFHCKSNVRIKNWTKRKWNCLAKKLLRNGYTIVELGKEQIVKSKHASYMNCTGSRSLQEIAKIIECAEGFVGIDSGFAHIANCFNIPAVLIFGVYYHYTNYKVYSGYYANPKNCAIIFDHKYGSFHVKVNDVFKAVQKSISNE